MTTTPNNLPKGIDPEVVDLQTTKVFQTVFSEQDHMIVHLDNDGDLVVEIKHDGRYAHTWLPLDEMIVLRDHLTKLIDGPDQD